MAKKQKRTKKDNFLIKLEREIQNFLDSLGSEEIPAIKLFKSLSLPRSQEGLFFEALERLVESNTIRKGKKGYRLLPKNADAIVGILRVHPRGFGFLQPEDPSKQDEVFIPKHLTQNAVDGDKVEVVVNLHSVSAKGPEGRVVSILSRARSHLAGIIHKVLADGYGLAYVPLLGIEKSALVEPTDFELTVGDRVVMQVEEWGEERKETLCKAMRKIGHISDPSTDVAAAIEEYELRSDFPQYVIQEAKAYGKTVTEEEIKGREDLRALETFTIDPDTAKDFDDALSLSQDKKGNFHLAVHIADVSHYVRPGTALDAEAMERCNSTYFPGTCIPMLPHDLSDNLCSLKPNVDRLTVSLLVKLDAEGNQLDYKVARSVINSQKRFTYKEAKKVLDGTLESPHADTLHLMVKLCQLLKKKRYERGSIEFAMPELVVLVDQTGTPTGTDYVEYDITHQLVEEFMLKANELVATHLTQKGKNLAYRIHDEPSEEGLKDFSSLAAAFGYQLSETPKPRELQQLFEEALNKPFGEFLATSYIRRMRMASYSADNIGHYGLMLTHYCHFTSPIRRYIDLTVHRVLFGESDDRETLSSTAELCSEQERISGKAENSVLQLKKLRLMDKMRKSDPKRQYDAVVTRVKPFGVFFEVLDFMLEGFLHVSQLSNDYYYFNEEKMMLEGDFTGGTFHAGDKICVMLGNIDFILQESSWNLVTESGPSSGGGARKKKATKVKVKAKGHRRGKRKR